VRVPPAVVIVTRE
jgi:hypothetical protein